MKRLSFILVLVAVMLLGNLAWAADGASFTVGANYLSVTYKSEASETKGTGYEVSGRINFEALPELAISAVYGTVTTKEDQGTATSLSLLGEYTLYDQEGLKVAAKAGWQNEENKNETVTAKANAIYLGGSLAYPLVKNLTASAEVGYFGFLKGEVGGTTTKFDYNGIAYSAGLEYQLADYVPGLAVNFAYRGGTTNIKLEGASEATKSTSQILTLGATYSF